MRACGMEDVVSLFWRETAVPASVAGCAVPSVSYGDRVFLVGPENRLVVTAVQAILDGTHSAWNPIFFSGPSGTGKTHLARGLIAAWQCSRPRRMKAVYVGASDFARELSEAIEAESTDDLRARYRYAALAIFDEVAHLRGKPAAQNELVYTIDALVAGGNRVVLTSVSMPWEVADVAAALRSRMTSGLVVPITEPASQTRKALLRHFADLQQVDITDGAIDLLASNCPANPAVLKGIIAQLGALAQFDGQSIDETVVGQWLRQQKTNHLASFRHITAETGRYFSLRASDLRGQSRRRLIATARGIAIYLVRELTNCSLKQIGEYFGRRDHTTVLHSYLKTKSALDCDPETRKAVAAIAQRIQAPLPEQ